MNERYGRKRGALIAIHGGAGPQDPTQEGINRANKALAKIAKEAFKMLEKGIPLTKIVTQCLRKLEDDPQFNAGVGSALQSDGVPRLSASLMDGEKQAFSGVIGVTYLSYPSLLVEALQTRRARVLTHPGTELLARELNIPVHSNLTERRSKKWLKHMEKTKYPSKYYDCDTVGVIIRSEDGHLVAGSSTGGRGHEYPGRVGDTSSVAGNYASKWAAIAVTGHGEQITDDAVAVRIETRVRDGMTLQEASHKTFEEALKKKRRYGWIALDRKGGWAIAHTTNLMPYIIWSVDGKVDMFSMDDQ